MSRDIFRLAILGADGVTRWNLTDPNGPVQLRGTPEGLQGAPFDLNYQQNVGAGGEEYKGRTHKRNPITIGVRVQSPQVGTAARMLHTRWRNSLGDADNPARMVVVTSESGYRWKDVRLASATQALDWQRPGELGVVTEKVNLVSDSSWWTHMEHSMMWTAAEAPQATMWNPGNRPAWLRYTVTGPMSGCYIGLGHDRVRLPAIPSGGFILVDTDPAFPTATDQDGKDLYETNPHWVFQSALPAGGNRAPAVPLGILPIAPGDGAVVVASITPQSDAAW